ncbi:ABC transporter substrate-binding protein [Synergistales bacterium]|nr:ABC transporter substrate-binding protein [Synergistales bacterium]
MKRAKMVLAVLALAVMTVMSYSACALAAGAQGKGYVIGFTDNYNGNTLHQQQERYFQEIADQMKKDGIISEYHMVVANQDVATQVSQIQNFIMMGCDAIIIDPTSTSGLDGAIKEAYDAGVKVMIFNDGPVSSPYCYQLNVDCVANFGYLTEWCAKKLGYKGNVIVVRGIAGTGYDALSYKGITDVIAKYPDMKIVGEVYGEWTSTVAQAKISAILPSLPKVDLVCGESGDAYGAAMAFESAGLPIPLIYGGNRGEFLNWWMKENKKNGYETISGVATPWFSAAALFLTIDLLDGVKIPQYMYYPMDLITQENLSKFEGISDTEVATSVYDLQWVRNTLETQDEKANKPEMVKDK